MVSARYEVFQSSCCSGCVTIGRYRYLFKRLTAVSARRFYRFEHMVTYSSGKVVAKWANPFALKNTIKARGCL